MVERRLYVVLTAVVGGLLLAGCECNKTTHSSIDDNLNGSDWRHTVKECGYGYDASCNDWTGRAVASLSPLKSNVEGTDWRRAEKDCGRGWDAQFDRWWGRTIGTVYGLNSNLSGADWRDYVVGSCDTPAGDNQPRASGQK